MIEYGCIRCGKQESVCFSCNYCDAHCRCVPYTNMFDADELGLDPETDNTPDTGSRHA